MFEAFVFLLECVVKNGDSHEAAKAKRFLQMVKEEHDAALASAAPLRTIQDSLPHDGSQSPQTKTDDGLGGTSDGNDNLQE